jgi:hypothetical protein
LGEEFRRTHPGVDFPALATQLSLLPDLRYLEDGLRRSRLAIASHGTELAECLRAVPGNRFEPDELIHAMEALLTWIEQQEWPQDDPRLRVMVSEHEAGRHPLAGYCLSACFLWPNLFYAPKPIEGSGELALSLDKRYVDLMGEFSMYVIAAQSTMEPAEYMAFCERWWRSERLPSRPPYPDRRVLNRVAHASRVMRRLTLFEHRELFLALVQHADSTPFHERVSIALRSARDEAEQNSLEALTRLLEEVRLGWRRPDAKSAAATGRPRETSSRVTQQRLRDGFLRIPEQPAMMTTEVSTDGWTVLSVMPQPPTLETLTRDLLLTKESEAIRSLVQNEAEDDADLADEDLAALREQAHIEAEREIDGLEWMPADESAGADIIESILLDEVGEESGSATPPKTCGIGAHIRRFRYAHDLTKDRLTARQALAILHVLPREPRDSPAKEALAALHASIALGRPLENLVGMQICENKFDAQGTDGRVGYVLSKKRWVLPAPAAAWADQPRTAEERPQWSELWLTDRTGFGELLAHFHLAVPGKLFQKRTTLRMQAIADFLQRSLPHSAVTTAQCAKFLHRELLVVSGGDLGLAALITGHHHGHSASVAHYANYRAQRVWETYRRVWKGQEALTEPANPKHIEPSPAAGYGARRVPTVRAVIALLKHLRGLVMEGTDVQRHNAYTAYTLAGLVLGTAMRPVVSPLIDLPAQIRGLPAMLSYVDKARTDYHRRIVAVPRALESHLRVYLRYLLAHGLTREDAPLPLIYIDPDTGLDEPFRPSHALGLTTPAFGLEVYALRRFVRTHLREVHDVASEDLDAWMGHWLHRVSPHDMLSTYPMRRLGDLAEGPVERMLGEVGFVPLKGPPWGR